MKMRNNWGRQACSRRLWVSLLALLLVYVTSARPAHSQAQKTIVIPQRIPYISHLPAPIRRLTPSGTQSCFFGSFKLGLNKPTTMVHLYREAQEQTGIVAESSFTLDLIEIESKSHTGKSRYRLLQRVPITYDGWDWVTTKFGAELLWLDPAQRRYPIIKFNCLSASEYGPSGDHVLAVFTQGLTKKPTIQNFTFGAWHSSTTSGASNSFNTVDEKGLLQIQRQIYLATNEVPKPAPEIWRWNGKEFTTAIASP